MAKSLIMLTKGAIIAQVINISNPPLLLQVINHRTLYVKDVTACCSSELVKGKYFLSYNIHSARLHALTVQKKKREEEIWDGESEDHL